MANSKETMEMTVENASNKNNNAVTSVPDECLIVFFENASKALEKLDMKQIMKMTKSSNNNSNSYEDGRIKAEPAEALSLADCRRIVLEKQKSILHQSISLSSGVSVTHVQKRLSKLRQEENLSLELRSHMARLDETARLSLCELVLYSQECGSTTRATSINSTSGNNHDDDDGSGHKSNGETKNQFENYLQTTGSMDRSRLLEFIALNRCAISLPIVKQFLINGPPLFPDGDPTNDDQKGGRGESSKVPAAILRFPQSRLEYVQSLLSRAIGWDPQFTTRELTRIFFAVSSTLDNEFSNDEEIHEAFNFLMKESRTAIRDATLRQQQQQLSDIDQGGVTRVVSVQYSEVVVGNSSDNPDDAMPGNRNNNAPKKVCMDNASQRLSEHEQKRQIRLASDASLASQSLLEGLLSMSGKERNKQLQKAQIADDEFTKRVLEIPPGRQRLILLQSIDPDTSELLLIHKTWEAYIARTSNSLHTASNTK